MRLSASLLTGALLLGACATSSPDPSGRADGDMARVLAALAARNPIPIETLPPLQARQQPSAAQAALDVQRQLGNTAVPQPPVASRDLTVPAAVGSVPARLYTPSSAGVGPRPIVLYFGGGGWVIANDLETYDGGARGLAAASGALVLHVQYRRAPEVRFPASHDDAIAAYRWLLSNAGVLGGDPRRIAVAGESAGGNLALATSMAARDGGLPRPVHQVLVYPVASTDPTLQSVLDHATSKPLGRAQVTWFGQQYVGDPAVLTNDGRLNPAQRANLSNLPPTTIVLAEIDPLRSGGELLARRLREAGTPVESRTWDGAAHEFFGMAPVVADAREAQAFAGARLRAGFDAVPPLVASERVRVR